MPEDIDQLKERIGHLEEVINTLILSDRMYVKKDIQLADGRDLIIASGVGTKIGNASSKIGFYGSTPVVQFASPTGAQDTSGSSGTTMTTGHRFNGNVGTDYYSVGDIVYALKICGIIKNE